MSNEPHKGLGTTIYKSDCKIADSAQKSKLRNITNLDQNIQLVKNNSCAWQYKYFILAISQFKMEKKRTEEYLQKSENRHDTSQNLRERMFRENLFVKHILVKMKKKR